MNWAKECMARCKSTMLWGKTCCGSALAKLQVWQPNLFASIWRTQECFQVSLHSHTACIWRALKPQNIMYLKSSPWPLRSTDWCFNQTDPERLLTNIHYFIFLFLLLPVCLSLYGFSTFGPKLFFFSFLVEGCFFQSNEKLQDNLRNISFRHQTAPKLNHFNVIF